MRLIAYACHFLFFAGVSLLPASAQLNDNDVSAEAEARLSAEAIQLQRQAAVNAADLDESTRARILDHYDDALQHLEARDEWERRAREYEELRLAAPATVEEIQEQLATSPPPIELGVTEETPLVELGHALSSAEAELATRANNVDELAAEPARRDLRRRELPELLLDARNRRQAARAELTAAPADVPLLNTARQTALRARLQKLNAEIESYEQEQLSYDARGTLLNLRQELADRSRDRAEQRVQALRHLLTQRRQEEAAAAAARARETMVETLQAAPEVRERFMEIAAINQELAEQRTATDGLINRNIAAQRRHEQLATRIAEIEAQFESVQARIAAAGLSEGVALLLRRYRAELPNVRILNQEMRERVARIADLDLAVIDLQEQRDALSDINRRVEELVLELPPEYEEEEREEIAGTMRSQLQSQRELLLHTINDHQTYASTLSELNARQRDLVQLTERFREYVSENIFWTAGARTMRLEDVRHAAEALAWLADAGAWAELRGAMASDFRRRIPLYLLAPFFFLALFYLKFRLRRQIPQLGERARKKWHVSYRETAAAFIGTVLIVLPLPVLTAFLGWRLVAGAQASLLAAAIANGLFAVGLVWTMIELLRQLLARAGLAECHFDWAAAQVRGARHYLSLLAMGLLPLIFLVFCYEYQPNEAWKTSLGRSAYILACLLLSGSAFILVRGIFRVMDEGERKSWLAEHKTTRGFILALCVGAPILFGIVAFSGYYYTSLQLGIRVFWSIAFLFGIILLASLMRRWMVLAKRRLAITQAKRRREAMLAEEEAGAKTEQEEIEEELDLVRLDAQTQSLMRSFSFVVVALGTYFIWVDVLPALAVLERWEVWHTTVQVERERMVDGESVFDTISRREPVTAANVLLALIIAGMAIIAVKNLPSLLEIILLQRLQLGAGERYATLAIVRYVLTGIGIFLFFRAIGVGWSNVQWLVAAVGLGLGFGLQEIFANFVSGLILLFERPVRVGDIVTIGDKSGVVSKIRIRATTLTDWDRRELVIPNKELVTGQVTNWTLNDRTLRQVLPVGVAYGSDTRLAKEILLRCADEHPDVLKDPPPMVVFDKFGNSTLDFELRYIAPLEFGLTSRTDVNMMIADAFAEAGIEIAFPQRDLHIRSGLEHLQPKKDEKPTEIVPEAAEIPEEGDSAPESAPPGM